MDRKGSTAMLIRFWGTRGSLPAPLNFRAVRSKIRAALLAARRAEPGRSGRCRSIHRSHTALFGRRHLRRQYQLRRDRNRRR